MTVTNICIMGGKTQTSTSRVPLKEDDDTCLSEDSSSSEPEDHNTDLHWLHLEKAWYPGHRQWCEVGLDA